MKTLLLIGYGNLAKSIFQGIAQSPLANDYQFCIYGRNLLKAQNFASLFPTLKINVLQDLEELKNINPIILLCVKPKGLQSFSFHYPAELIYSVMAGVKIEEIKKYFPQAKAYARAMPNVGASVQHSSTALYLQPQTQEFTTLAHSLTQTFGTSMMVGSEDLIDSSIATSGSSPAFLALIAEALIDSGVREGIDRLTSTQLVNATFEGFAKLLNSYTPQEIKTLVTSPGGTTAEGLAHLENNSLKGILQEAGHKAVLKAKGKL